MAMSASPASAAPTQLDGHAPSGLAPPPVTDANGNLTFSAQRNGATVRRRADRHQYQCRQLHED